MIKTHKHINWINSRCTYTLNVIVKMNNKFNMMREISKTIRNILRRLHQILKMNDWQKAE